MPRTARRSGPCHQPQTGGPKAFDQAESYLRWVLELASAGIAGGLAPLEVARRSGFGEFGALLDPERLVGNLYRAYLELEWPERPLGSEIDVRGAFQKMIDLNGGEPFRCLA